MILGHYELGSRLGEGGMGVVYEALDQKLGRRVAIKLLNEKACDSSHAVERFLARGAHCFVIKTIRQFVRFTS